MTAGSCQRVTPPRTGLYHHPSFQEKRLHRELNPENLDRHGNTIHPRDHRRAHRDCTHARAHRDGLPTGVANHPHRLAAAALLYLIAAATSVGIALALYPVLKKVNAALALGSVVFRTIEAVFYTAAVVNLLSILTLGQQLATAPADNRAPIQAIADSLLSIGDHSSLAAVFAFTLGALMYYTLFYRARLVPRWLSGWGAAAALLMLTACLLALFSNSPRDRLHVPHPAYRRPGTCHGPSGCWSKASALSSKGLSQVTSVMPRSTSAHPNR